MNQQDSNGNDELLRLVSTGYDCLHSKSCKKNVPEIAKILLEAGSSMDMKTNAGQMALSLVKSDVKLALFRTPFQEHMIRTTHHEDVRG